MAQNHAGQDQRIAGGRLIHDERQYPAGQNSERSESPASPLTETAEHNDIGIVVASAGDRKFLAVA
jgi:hypothetical protein